MNMEAKFFYKESTLISVVAGERASRYVRTKDVIMCELANNIAPASLLACELSGTVNVAASFNKWMKFVYAPYGRRSNNFSEASQLGFNGEYLHPGIAMYLLGNGYRAYNPATMRFLSPDSISPFQVVNAYGYCGNDPINKADPSGHFPVLAQGHAIKLKARIKLLKASSMEMQLNLDSVKNLGHTARLKDAEAIASLAKQGIKKAYVEASPAFNWLSGKLQNPKYAGGGKLIKETLLEFHAAYRRTQERVDVAVESKIGDWAKNEAELNIEVEKAMLTVRGAPNL